MSATFFCFNCKRDRPIEEKVIVRKRVVRCVYCEKARKEVMKKKRVMK